MVVGAKVCDLTEDLLWFVCGLYVGILTSSLSVVRLFQGGDNRTYVGCFLFCVPGMQGRGSKSHTYFSSYAVRHTALLIISCCLTVLPGTALAKSRPIRGQKTIFAPGWSN